MDPLRWQRIESICEAVLDRPPLERDAAIRDACGQDALLESEVRGLLSELDQRPGFLEHPIVEAGLAVTALTPDTGPIPEMVGPYRVERLLGRGGMGEVYLATRRADDVQQTVALKVIKLGLATGEILERFRLERRILARLDHPNIARLLDAGATEDGRPYFVMEYVDGTPIDQFCNAHRLGIEQRLRLFQIICAAVQHAHRNLVVHRDLKPGNILVTRDGAPKLLDFGIGKVLATTDGLAPGVQTRTDVRLLTPDYAAPEQVRGDPVTTATDVYGLGVLLYELLTGRHPHRSGGSSRAEIERAVLEVNPVPPSAALETDSPDRAGRGRLAGDLDTIVLHALRKEPDRRYASAAAFADDLERYLNGRPVVARPDTFGYRARKFIARNRAGVAAVLIASVALAATTVVTLIQSARVRRESERVTQERDKALEVRSFLMEMFGATGGSQAGDTVSVRRLLDLQAARIDEAYPAASDVKADMLEVLADGYDRLGLARAAEPLAQQALALRQQLQDSLNPDVAGALNLVGWITHELGRSADAEPLLLRSAIIRRAAGPRYQQDLSHSLNDLGVVLNARNRYDSAETVLGEALAIRVAELGPRHRAVGITANNLAAAYYFQGKYTDAVRVQDQAIAALQASLGADHQRTIVALSNAAAFKRTLGDWKSAAADYRDLLGRQARIQGADHPVTARVMIQLATALMEQGIGHPNDPALEEADTLFRRALAIFEAKLGPEHPQVGITLYGLGGVQNERGHLPEALATAERAVRLLRAGVGDANQNTALAVERLANAHWRLGAPAEAIRFQRQSLDALVRAAGPRHPETARAQAVLCSFLAFQGQALEEARQLCTDAIAGIESAPPALRRLQPTFELWLAQVDLALGRRTEAGALLDKVRTEISGGSAGVAASRLLDSLSRALSGAMP